MDLLNIAIAKAATAHSGQLDKAGEPYILHPIRVMLSLTSNQDRICGVLHDIIEDTDVTIEELKNLGFPEEILEAISLLTKQEGETYEDFISRLLLNPIACRVKLADLNDNMDLSRIQTLGEKDFARIRKYEVAKKRILQSKVLNMG